MEAYICDCCGCAYTKHNIPTTGRIQGGYLGGLCFMDRNYDRDKSVDLCDDCILDIQKFIENHPKNEVIKCD